MEQGHHPDSDAAIAHAKAKAMALVESYISELENDLRQSLALGYSQKTRQGFPVSEESFLREFCRQMRERLG